MAEQRAQRTLVKSPPELWAEISDLDALTRHLGEFGEIRITRLEPETAVAWEGDRARGTVELEPSGWGTKVTLTADLQDGGEAADAVAETPPEADASPSPPEPEAEPEPEPEPAPVADPAPHAEADPDAAARPRLFSRLFRRRTKPPAVAEPAAVAQPEPEPEPQVAPEPEPEPEPEPVVVALAPQPEARPEPSVDEDRAAAILTEVLDDLGSARHRPFSRAD